MRLLFIILLFPMLSYGQVFTSYSGIDPDCKKIGDPCGGETELRYEGQTYQLVAIGDRCWFKENLNVGTRIDATTNQRDNATLEKWCYNNREDSCTIYGGLYQWDEAMQYVTTEGAQGICPTGWHIPTEAEYQALSTCFGGESKSGGKLKEYGTRHWNSPNVGATNKSGFTALGSGFYYYDTFWDSRGNFGQLWSSKEYTNQTYGMYLNIQKESFNTWVYPYMKTAGFAIRCIKDL